MADIATVRGPFTVAQKAASIVRGIGEALDDRGDAAAIVVAMADHYNLDLAALARYTRAGQAAAATAQAPQQQQQQQPVEPVQQ